MATLGEAFIEVHADTRPFAKELKQQVTAILRAVDKTMGTEGTRLGATLGKGVGVGFDKETDTIGATFGQRLRMRMRQIGSDAAGEFSKSFQRLATSNFIFFRVIGSMAQRLGALFTTLRRVGGEVFNVGKTLLQANKAMMQLGFEGVKSLLGFSNDLSRSFTSAQQAGGNLAGALASLATSATSGALGLAAMAAAAVLLIGVTAALAAIVVVALAPFAQLLNFALLLPAAFGVLVAVIAPLVIALNGLGDAMGLVFEQDPEKFAEGLAKLSPVMRELTVMLRGFAPLFRSIQTKVQQNFLRPIISALGPVLRDIGPSLRRGLGEAALAMGTFVAKALELLREPAFRQFIDELFPAVSRMVESLSGPLLHLLTALAKAATASLPTVERLVTSLGGFLDTFATWIETTVADGRFQKFLDDAVASAQDIWDLIKALIGLFAEMFTQTDDGGRRFLEKITEAINKFTTWLRSPDGKKALEDAVVLALAFAEAFKVALAIVRVIVSELSRSIRLAYALLELLGIIDSKKPAAQTGTSLAHTTLPGYNGGGVVGYDQLAIVHKGEPILDPANSTERNRSILAEAGMLDLLAQPMSTVVYIGGEKLYEHIDYRVDRDNKASARSITYGARS